MSNRSITLDLVCLDFEPSEELKKLAETFGGKVHTMHTNEGRIPSIRHLLPDEATRE